MSTGPFPAPVTARTGGGPEAPLVVLLHGRGSHEGEILSLAEHLPEGPEYVALRAPIAENGGFAWFANRGIGRPQPDSLRATMDWFRSWLDGYAAAGRPVVLVGFSGGTAFAGGVLLDHPDRYAGAALMYGTLPFDAGVPTSGGRLCGIPIFLAQGEFDTVIPPELQERTWDYLTNTSAGVVSARRDPVGHSIASEALKDLGGWIETTLVLPAAG